MDRPENPPLHDDLPAFFKMGTELARSDRAELALALIAKSASERPGDPRLTSVGRAISSYQVHNFHYGMLRDSLRNSLYRQAIERLAPGKRVLDIGTGSGLLSMIAARAGAKSVFTCELNPMLAATAREIIAANGLSDTITVLGRHSTMLDRNGDLDGGVDLVISEIFSDDLLGEGVLPSLKHAREELCLPGAVFIPESADIRVAMASHPDAAESLDRIEGFDLSLFNRHLAAVQTYNPSNPKLVLCGDPQTLFQFDFNAAQFPPEVGEASANLGEVSQAANGVAQWIRFSLAEGLSYENYPGSDRTAHWPVRFTPINLPEEIRGTSFELGGWHNEDRLVLWPAAARNDG